MSREDLDSLGYERAVAELVECGIDLYRDGDNGDEYDIASALAEGTEFTIYTRHCFAIVRFSPNCDALFEFDPDALRSCANSSEVIERLAFHALREDIAQGMRERLREIREEVSKQTGGEEVTL